MPGTLFERPGDFRISLTASADDDRARAAGLPRGGGMNQPLRANRSRQAIGVGGAVRRHEDVVVVEERRRHWR